MRGRGIVFAGFVVCWRTRDYRSTWYLENSWGAGAAWGGRENSGWGVSWTTNSGWWCFLDNLKAFGINTDQWTTAAQDEGEWRKTVE